MALKLYNTRTKTKEEFQPIAPTKNVRMYVCGPTVYDNAHIGNARPVIVFDVLFRLLRHLYGENHVTYVRNITDVDDKINARAAQAYPDLPPLDGIAKLTKDTTAQFHADVAALGCLPPTHEPRATDYVAKPDAASDMIRIVQRLIERGHAYEAEGHVLFAVATDPNYGKLARRSLDEMQAGARVEVAPYKRDAMDFVLWKPSVSVGEAVGDKRTEPGWNSPWGYGRPGWHLECSAMSAALLGETFDIHGGGIDLVFPHHENEVAQSTCAHGTPLMANIWMHNGFLQVEGEKMSKSLGNFVTINEVLSGWRDFPWPGEAIRLAMLSTHYRQPIDWTSEKLEQACMLLSEAKQFGFEDSETEPSADFVSALKDDLNTPKAIAVLHELSKVARYAGLVPIKRVGEPVSVMNPDSFLPRKQLLANLRLLGIEVEKFEMPRFAREVKINEPKIRSAISARAEARAAKNFAEADRIRDELAAMGIALKDTKDPATGEIVTTWEIAR
ncbi:MAG: cysteine--tRNA ligase [Hyphomicrobiales bacterium]|nr:cysteine--tRNA ligase [Hyphomicrobiales bacterium]